MIATKVIEGLRVAFLVLGAFRSTSTLDFNSVAKRSTDERFTCMRCGPNEENRRSGDLLCRGFCPRHRNVLDDVRVPARCLD